MKAIMKKLFLTLLVAVGLLSTQSSAQVNVNVNIGSQPLWAPVGYDYVEYYYLPAIESYYYVPKRQFIYMDGGRWNFSYSLPSRYSGYDLDRGYKVVINVNNAYRNFDRDRIRYAKYKKVRGQKIIRYSNDPRYYVVKDHPHGMPPGQAKKVHFSESGGHGKGHGNGKSNRKGKH
jgi:hypothetical protein